MNNAGTNAYQRGRQAQIKRLVLEMPPEEINRIDAWGGPAGFPSRTAAVRHLIERGLAAETAAPAAGEASRA